MWDTICEKAKDSNYFNYKFNSSGINESGIYHKIFDKLKISNLRRIAID
jgi:hypothetical protein